MLANSPSWPVAGTVKLRKDELCALSRSELQALAKEHGIKANQKTDVLIRDLMAKLAASAEEGRSFSPPEMSTALMFGDLETETAALDAGALAKGVETSSAAALDDAEAPAKLAVEPAGTVDAEMAEVEVTADTSVQACTKMDAQTTAAALGEAVAEPEAAEAQATPHPSTLHRCPSHTPPPSPTRTRTWPPVSSKPLSCCISSSTGHVGTPQHISEKAIDRQGYS